MKSFLIGTRGSALALAQASWTQKKLQSHFPNHSFELKIIKTLGDHLQKSTPDSTSPPLDKGLFTKELEAALLCKEIDFAVHSLKDLPTEIAPGLTIAAIPQRANPHDVLITRETLRFTDLPQGACLGTGSLRRQKELLRLRPDLCFIAIRGNIDTRLEKLRMTHEWHGLILAAAGLERLSLNLDAFKVTQFEPEMMLPAPGQGALAIQTRTNDDPTLEIAEALEHPATRDCVKAERQFLAGLGGGCQFPLGAYGQITEDHTLYLQTRFYDSLNHCHYSNFTFSRVEAAQLSYQEAKKIKVN